VTKAWEEKYKENIYVYELVARDISINLDGTSQTRTHTILKLQKESGKDAGEVTLKTHHCL
jgi:hypothetical protein